MAFYGRELAHVHDAGFGDFARAAAPGLLRRIARAGAQNGLVVDLGCGSGIWARVLTDAGYGVLGIDVSQAMLAIARRRAPRARFVRGSALELELPRCSAVTAIGECLSYANESRTGIGALRAVFRRVRRRLGPGGTFLFDVATPGREGATPRRGWHAGADWVLCLDAAEDQARRELVRQITVFRRDGRAWRRTDEVHRLALYEPAAVLGLLADCGFEARRLRGYGPELRFPRGLAGFAATRR